MQTKKKTHEGIFGHTLTQVVQPHSENVFGYTLAERTPSLVCVSFKARLLKSCMLLNCLGALCNITSLVSFAPVKEGVQRAVMKPLMLNSASLLWRPGFKADAALWMPITCPLAAYVQSLLQDENSSRIHHC